MEKRFVFPNCQVSKVIKDELRVWVPDIGAGWALQVPGRKDALRRFPENCSELVVVCADGEPENKGSVFPKDDNWRLRHVPVIEVRFRGHAIYERVQTATGFWELHVTVPQLRVVHNFPLPEGDGFFFFGEPPKPAARGAAVGDGPGPHEPFPP